LELNLELTQLSQIRLELKLVDLRKIEIELKFEFELHLFKSSSKFNPSSIHAQIQIRSDKHENSKESYAKNGNDYCDTCIRMDRQCDIIIIDKAT